MRRCFPSFPFDTQSLRFFGNDIDYTTTRFCFLVNTGLESSGCRCVGGLFLFCIFPASAMIFHVDPISEFSVRASMAAFYSLQVSLCLRHSTAALFVLSCRWLFTILLPPRNYFVAFDGDKSNRPILQSIKLNGSARSRPANAFFSLLPLPSVLIPHQVRLSLRKELLGLVFGTSLNHRPTLRVMYAPASSHCPWFLPALEKLPRSLMCT